MTALPFKSPGNKQTKNRNTNQHNDTQATSEQNTHQANLQQARDLDREATQNHPQAAPGRRESSRTASEGLWRQGLELVESEAEAAGLALAGVALRMPSEVEGNGGASSFPCKTTQKGGGSFWLRGKNPPPKRDLSLNMAVEDI